MPRYDDFDSGESCFPQALRSRLLMRRDKQFSARIFGSPHGPEEWSLRPLLRVAARSSSRIKWMGPPRSEHPAIPLMFAVRGNRRRSRLCSGRSVDAAREHHHQRLRPAEISLRSRVSRATSSALGVEPPRLGQNARERMSAHAV